MRDRFLQKSYDIPKTVKRVDKNSATVVSFDAISYQHSIIFSTGGAMPKLFVDTDELYDVNEAAEKLGISVPTAWRWIRDEKLIVIRMGGRTLVPRSEIKRLNPSGDGVNPSK